MKQTLRQVALCVALGVGAVSLVGCSVARNQQTAGSYVDDAAITTKIKAAFAEDRSVAATSISVETLKGEVQLSGFAKSQAERDRAGELARRVEGVKAVRNSVVVR